jgi:hypothetical protein
MAMISVPPVPEPARVLAADAGAAFGAAAVPAAAGALAGADAEQAARSWVPAVAPKARLSFNRVRRFIPGRPADVSNMA